jgi:hypothetical protein
MDETDDYCELCDLPKSQCIHGNPPPPPPPKAAARQAAPRKAAVKAPPKPRKATSPALTPRKPVTLRWTPPEVFKPLILSVLAEHGGELEAEDLYRELETIAGDHLHEADSERTPEGELRWQYAARRARVALIKEGHMTKGRPGVWRLS